MKHVAGEQKMNFVKAFERILKGSVFFVLKLIFPELSKKSHDLVISRAFDAPWKTDQKFQELYNSVKDYTLNDIQRLHTLWSLAQQAKGLEGDFIEVGCWKGGTGAIISSALNNDGSKKILCDTFEGIPRIHGNNDPNYKGGEHSGASKLEVEKLLHKLDIDNFMVMEGIFSNASIYESNIKNIKFAHLDVDTYESTSEIFKVIEGMLIKNSIVVIDDFNIHKAVGIKKFVQEINLEKYLVINNFVGQAILIKK
jgi:O-methyltransferase